MPFGLQHRHTARWVLAIASALTVGLALAGPALARPVVAPVANSSVHRLISKTGSCTVSIETSAQTIEQGSSFRYTVRVAAPDGAGAVRVRFRLLRDTGKLIYQRTRVVAHPDGKTSTFTFERPTAGIGMNPGVYPVQLEIESSCEDTSAVATMESDLIVYDPDDPKVPLLIALRVPGQPLSNPDGLFVSDPGRFTRARDDVSAVLRHLLASPSARITLAISPLLLEEWDRIANHGYQLAGPEGVVKVAADSPAGRAYAETLALLDQGLQTGRLELAWQGYSDPNLDTLAEHGLGGDADIQYERGLSALFASVASTPSPVTMPAGGGLPQSTLASLEQQGITCVIAEPGRVRTATRLASPGAFRTKSGVRIVLADRVMSKAVTSGDTRGALEQALEFQDQRPGQPLVVTGTLGSGALDVPTLVGALERLTAQSWTRATNAASIAVSATPVVSLTPGRVRDQAPAAYWQDVSVARASARALSAALSAESPQVLTASDDSLIAESSGWTGFDGAWALAENGRAYASAATRIAGTVFDPVELTIRPVTLAGDNGDVPITIKNTGDYTLNLRLVVDPSPGVILTDKLAESVLIPPKESFFEVPVRLSAVLQGTISVKLMAGDSVLDKRTVRVSASYLDRLALIGVVLVALIALLVYIIRRVRRAENAEGPVDAVH